ncbi:hypothetical protein E4U13_000787 [Claviceps humidiphila]|uniref:Uncharacterized protein n=1 Tax=Claviceps humidiphila TaxID=1294629 RepID=A0A9P7TVK4_9HYPO|nr:hypothetical protein E4U13_000787 [Claviceps humidiphila]
MAADYPSTKHWLGAWEGWLLADIGATRNGADCASVFPVRCRRTKIYGILRASNPLPDFAKYLDPRKTPTAKFFL